MGKIHVDMPLILAVERKRQAADQERLHTQPRDRRRWPRWAKIINSAVTLAQINTQKAQKEAQTAVDLAKRKKKAAEDETAAKERKELAKATWYT